MVSYLIIKKGGYYEKGITIQFSKTINKQNHMQSLL